MTRIALIHATPAAVGPIKDAFAEAWPEPDLVNLLDDSLSRDRTLTPELTDRIFRRFDALGRYAVSFGAEAILFTCSAFGPAIERVGRSVNIPVLKPNEAMFAEAIAVGGRIGMLATFEPSIASMAEEFEEQATRAGVPAKLKSLLVPRAMAALQAGRREEHDALVAEPRPGSPVAMRSCSLSSRWLPRRRDCAVRHVFPCSPARILPSPP